MCISDKFELLCVSALNNTSKPVKTQGLFTGLQPPTEITSSVIPDVTDNSVQDLYKNDLQAEVIPQHVIKHVNATPKYRYRSQPQIQYATEYKTRLDFRGTSLSNHQICIRDCSTRMTDKKTKSSNILWLLA